MSIFSVFFLAVVLFVVFSSKLTFLYRPPKTKSKPNSGLKYAQFVISLVAKVVKSDGRVNEHEAEMVSNLLDDLTKQIGGNYRQRDILKSTYNIEKDSNKSAFSIAREFDYAFNIPNKEKMGLIYFFLNVAYADKNLNIDELSAIESIANGFGVSKTIKDMVFAKFKREFQSHHSGYKNSYQGYQKSQSSDESIKPTKDDYQILGVSKDASNSEIKKAWRELVKKYHPDLLMGRGESEEIVTSGTKKLQEINEAYENIKKQRNI